MAGWLVDWVVGVIKVWWGLGLKHSSGGAYAVALMVTNISSEIHIHVIKHMPISTFTEPESVASGPIHNRMRV